MNSHPTILFLGSLLILAVMFTTSRKAPPPPPAVPALDYTTVYKILSFGYSMGRDGKSLLMTEEAWKAENK